MGDDPVRGANPIVCTIFCKNYLAQVRSLHDSLRRSNPALTFVALMADRPDGLFDPSREPFAILETAALGIGDLPSLIAGHDLQGACCMLKPYLMRALLEQGYGPVIFMDPDILALDDLAPSIAEVGESTVSFTPHYLAPPRGDDRIALELRLLRGGTFNGGFIGVSGAAQSFAFLDWWSSRLRAFCRHDTATGIHYDQRWLDLAPSLFGDVKVLRDPGLNVAYWNFAQRALAVDDAGARVGAQPCRFFHFSGYDPAQPERMTRFEDDLPPVSRTAAAPLFARYRDALMRNGWPETHAWPYSQV